MGKISRPQQARLYFDETAAPIERYFGTRKTLLVLAYAMAGALQRAHFPWTALNFRQAELGGVISGRNQYRGPIGTPEEIRALMRATDFFRVWYYVRTRFFAGVFAPHYKCRALVVPKPKAEPIPEANDKPQANSRISWARLLKRVFNNRCRDLPLVLGQDEDHCRNRRA